MKNYTITVNGNVYDVVVEEGASTGAPVAAPKAAPKATPKAAPAAAPAAAPKAAGAAGGVKVEAGAAGKIFKVEAKVGQAVKAGDPVVILEAMALCKPILATIPAAKMQITSGENGLLCEANPESIAEGIEYLYLHREESEKYIQVLKENSLEKQNEEIMNSLYGLLDGK